VVSVAQGGRQQVHCLSQVGHKGRQGVWQKRRTMLASPCLPTLTPRMKKFAGLNRLKKEALRVSR
jgi:hypothetical protein